MSIGTGTGNKDNFGGSDLFNTAESVANQVLVPVITIDGPSASGKGTVAELVAQSLGWHVLDSGALYRLMAFAALKHNIQLEDEVALIALAANLHIRFAAQEIYLDEVIVTDQLKTEAVGAMASKIAALPKVRQALLQRQYDFRKAPGLVADGRDMGTVVFPDAALKIFLIANVVERAQRRYKQLINKGFSVTMQSLLEELQERDRRDTERSHAPLKAASDAIIIDSSDLNIQEVVDAILAHWCKLV